MNLHLISPENIKIIRNDIKLILVIRWAKFEYLIALVLFAVICVIFAPFYIEGMLQTIATTIALVVIVAWFGFVLYRLLCYLIGSTRVMMDGQRITCTTRPAFFKKNIELGLSQVVGFIVVERPNQGRSLKTYYDVTAKLLNESKQTLISYLYTHDQAAFIVDLLNDRLQK